MPVGFIKDDVQLMSMLLYILDRLDGPVNLGQLTDLALCDAGVDYFLFTDALAKLEETGHVTREEGDLFLITPKGRGNAAVLGDDVPYSVRKHCDRNVAAMNRELQRARQVRTEITRRADGVGYTVRLILDDENGNVMTMDLLAPDQTQAELVAERYKAAPERIYNVILSALVEEEG